MKNKKCLTLEDVEIIALGCESEALRHHWAVTIAIADDDGHLRQKRAARFQDHGHTPGAMTVQSKNLNRDFPFTLGLRRMPDIPSGRTPK